MTALEEVIDYLTKKVGKVNVNNPKANTGAQLIKLHAGWEDKISRLVMISLQNIQSQFTRKHPDYPPGECALTSVSMTVGKHCAPFIQREPLELKHQLALGDLMIEGFAYHGMVEVVEPQRFTRDPYKLRAAPKWAELRDIPNELIDLIIVGSVVDRPEIVTTRTQKIGEQWVDVHKKHEEVFDADAPYMKALNKLQQVEWTINDQVYTTIMKHKEEFASSEPIEGNKEKEQRRLSKAIEWKFITAKADVLKDHGSFFQIFDLDYRGRMYNVEPFLNYQSNDVAKGLMKFKQKKPLTESGEFWLAVHTACSYNQSYGIDEIPDWCVTDYHAHLEAEGLDNISVDKMTLEDRAQWTYQHADDIIRWADNDEIQFKAEKPVTFLACCYEWLDIELNGPMTSLPVAIDGSNNGWQHLGAISKDTRTGDLVGLIPRDIQQDFYVQTAKELINQTKDEECKEILAGMPMKHIRKGISKRGSMTRAYSAGAGKIAENMYFDCKTEDFHEKYGVTAKHCKKFARTLVKAIETVCPGPLSTMKYLQELAQFQLGKHEPVGPGDGEEFDALKKRRKELLAIKDKTDEELNELNDITVELDKYSFELVYGNGEKHIEWTTPSGFTAMYENFHMYEFKQRATLNGKQIKHTLNAPTDKPDTRGFMCGISPNYIHSLDAAHMALVIANWDGEFGAVHDSFSTHASDVEYLLYKTKQVFIDMYDHENYFDVIRENITNNTDDVEQPTLGSLNIKEIEDSDYFFA